ncbi:MAG: 60S ribosomal protein L31 [Candidatus Aenigmarchaeota archaeon]|nr:60S ribosomal protein L31 [Candidatus Aenigmarchaeota archaeon]
MAEVKAPKAEERLYTIPLRIHFVLDSRIRKANRAIRIIEDFAKRHTHADAVKISEKVNSEVWKRGAKRPAGRIRVKIKLEDGKAKVMLPEEIEIKSVEKKTTAAMLKEKITGKKVSEVEKEARKAIEEEKARPALKEKPEEKKASETQREERKAAEAVKQAEAKPAASELTDDKNKEEVRTKKPEAADKKREPAQKEDKPKAKEKK